jgi:mannose-6-phosphate isomerase-like protein (cupin superfamily)
MTSPMVAPPLTGNTLGSGSSSFVIAEWRDPGGPVGERRLIAPPYVHHHDDEAWDVLEGTLRIQMGQNEAEVRAVSGVLVPRGTTHTYWNPGPRPTRYLLIMTANIYQLIQEIHAMKERTPAALGAVLRKHGSELANT